MDAYAPKLIEHGLIGMIGKGERSSDVIDANGNNIYEIGRNKYKNYNK